MMMMMMMMMGSRSAGDGGWMLDGVVWCVVHTTRVPITWQTRDLR